MFSRRSNLFIVCIMLIVIGGVQQVTAVEMEAGTWTQKADMPTARNVAGAAVVDGKIYVIGGAPGPWGFTKAAEEYDPATDTWTKLADMPTARQSLCVAAVNGIIYAIGGWSEHVFLSTVEAYDPAADKWTKKTNMPTLRDAMSAVAVDGKIYVIGGNFHGNSVSTVEVYEPATDKWTRKADMPTARCYLAACVVDGRIYVSGGKEANRPGRPCLPTVEVYDPATDTWTQASDMPRTRNLHAASVVAGKMYIIGGQDEEAVKLWEEGKLEGDKLEELFSIVYVYDPATDTWTTAADSPFPTSGHAAGVVDGKIYAIGGARGAEKFSTVYEYNPGLPGAISSVSPAGKLLETWGQIKKVQ